MVQFFIGWSLLSGFVLEKKKEILKFFSFFVLFSPFNERIVVDFNKIEFVNLSFGRKFFYINNF